MAFKTCPQCNEKNPARIRKCKKCNAAFAFKVKKNKLNSKVKVMDDWKSLIVGDYIKVSGGPVWIDKDNNETPMGYDGIYVVVGFDENGILALGKDKSSGFCHIWMETEQYRNGLLKRPHKVSKINFQ